MVQGGELFALRCERSKSKEKGLHERGWLVDENASDQVDEGPVQKRYRPAAQEIQSCSSVASGRGLESIAQPPFAVPPSSDGIADTDLGLPAPELCADRVVSFGIGLGAGMDVAPAGYSSWAPKRGTWGPCATGSCPRWCPSLREAGPLAEDGVVPRRGCGSEQHDRHGLPRTASKTTIQCG